MTDEGYTDDLTSYSVDGDDQLQSGDSLIDRGVDDVLDEGYSPPEGYREANAFGTTAAEQAQGETLEMRIRQEEPDPNSAYGAPDNESGLDEDRVGGDDENSIDAADDTLGSDDSPDDRFDDVDDWRRSGRLVAPDEGAHPDQEKDMVGRDVGFDGGAASAEEAAMHIERE